MLSFSRMSTTLFKILNLLANGSRIFARVWPTKTQYLFLKNNKKYASVN